MKRREDLAAYPDPRSEGLRAAVAEKYGLEPERLIFGCGSDEIFTLLCQTYLEPGDNAIQTAHGFFAYRIAIRAAQGQVRFAPQPNLRIDVDEILSLVDERTKLVFLDNPGNPTAPGSAATRWSGCTQPCRAAASWCWTAPMPSSATIPRGTTGETWPSAIPTC